MNTQNFQPKNGALLTVNQKAFTHTKINHKRAFKLSFSDYSDAYFLVTGNAAVAGANNNTKVAFKNCVPFKKCRTEINETFIDEAEQCLCTI